MKGLVIQSESGQRAQSETLAVLALAAVVIILVAAIGGGVLSGLVTDEEPAFVALDAEITEDGVEISHNGGDVLSPNEVRVGIDGPATGEHSLAGFENVSERFGSGETATTSLETLAETAETVPHLESEYRLYIVHEPTNTLLFDEEVSLLLGGNQSDSIESDTQNQGGIGNSGFFRFNLTNSGDSTATVVGIGINSTTAQAVSSVDKYAGGDDILRAQKSGDQLLENPLTFNSTTPETAEEHELDTLLSLSSGETTELRFQRFIESENSHGDMRDEQVTVTLWFEDDSTTTMVLDD